MSEIVLAVVFTFFLIITIPSVVAVVKNTHRRRTIPICATCYHCMSCAQEYTPGGLKWTIRCNCGISDKGVAFCSFYRVDNEPVDVYNNQYDKGQ